MCTLILHLCVLLLVRQGIMGQQENLSDVTGLLIYEEQQDKLNLARNCSNTQTSAQKEMCKEMLPRAPEENQQISTQELMQKGNQSLDISHEKKQSFEVAYDPKQSTATVHEEKQSNNVAYEEKKFSTMAYEDNQSSVKAREGKISNTMVYDENDDKQFHATAYGDEQSNKMSHGENESVLIVHDEKQSNTMAYDEKQSYKMILKEKQDENQSNTMAYEENDDEKQSSTFNKKWLNTIVLEGKQLNAASQHDKQSGNSEELGHDQQEEWLDTVSTERPDIKRYTLDPTLRFPQWEHFPPPGYHSEHDMFFGHVGRGTTVQYNTVNDFNWEKWVSNTNDSLNSTVSQEDAAKVLRYDAVAIAVWKYGSPVILSTGTMGNILSVFIICRKKILHTTTSLYLLVLAFVDTGCLYTGLLHLYIKHVYSYDWRIYSTAACKLHMFGGSMFLQYGSWLLVSITMERLCAVCLPHKCKLIFTKRNSAIGLIIQAIIIAAINAHFLATHDVLRMKSGKTVCAATTNAPWHFTHFIWPSIDFCITSLIPSVLLLLSNGIIVYRIIHVESLRHLQLQVSLTMLLCKSY